MIWCAIHKSPEASTGICQVRAWWRDVSDIIEATDQSRGCSMVEALLIVKENELFPLGSVNRFEVIDWTIETGGRITSKWETYNYDVAFDIQDGGRTFKMFLLPLASVGGDSQ